jgi:hypothetical protein
MRSRMVAFNTRFKNPRHAIINRLLYCSERPGHRSFETNFATVQFLQAHLLPVGQREVMSYTGAFEDRIGREWQMRFFLALDEGGSWYVTRSQGSYTEDTSFPETATSEWK